MIPYSPVATDCHYDIAESTGLFSIEGKGWVIEGGIKLEVDMGMKTDILSEENSDGEKETENAERKAPTPR